METDREQVGRRGHLLDKRFPIHENEMPAICGVLRFVCVVVKEAVRDRTLCLEVHPDADLLIVLIGIFVQIELQARIRPFGIALCREFEIGARVFLGWIAWLCRKYLFGAVGVNVAVRRR